MLWGPGMNALTLAAVTLLTAAPSTGTTEPQAETPRVDGLRGRFAVGVMGAMGSDQGLPSFGLSLQLGAQLNDTWAVYAQLEGSSLLFFYNVGSAALMADATFADLITVGAGVGYVTSNRHTVDLSGLGGEPDRNMQGVQVPLRVQLNLGPTTSSALRHRFFIAAEGAAGFVRGNDTNGLIYTAGVSLGYALM